MLKSWLLLLAVAVWGVSSTWAGDLGKPQYPISSIKPANVSEVPFRTVFGTVTVRLNGALVEAEDVSYIFAPDFPAHTGSLARYDFGSYYLRADNVPEDRPFTLTVTARYDDSVKGRDGYIERRGRLYSGMVRIEVPHGRDVDFGFKFIDLR